MENLKKVLLTALSALLFVSCGVVLLYAFSVFYHSDNANKMMESRDVMEQELREQNEQFYNDIKSRYDTSIDNLNDYQEQTNERLSQLEDEVDALSESNSSEE